MIDPQIHDEIQSSLGAIAQKYGFDPEHFEQSVLLAHQFQAQNGRLPQPQELQALHSGGMPVPAGPPTGGPMPPEAPNALAGAQHSDPMPAPAGFPAIAPVQRPQTMSLQQLAALVTAANSNQPGGGSGGVRSVENPIAGNGPRMLRPEGYPAVQFGDSAYPLGPADNTNRQPWFGGR